MVKEVTNNELISVILPVYNVEKYLRKSVNSVLMQTYKNIEIILIDDGSTDRSGIICDRYAERDSRIKVFHTENRGLSEARNYGFEVSQGRYVFYLDSDDAISETCIELLYKKLIKTGSDFAQSAMKRVDKGRKQHDRLSPCSADSLNDVEYMKMILLGGDSVSSCGKLYKREIIDNIKNPSGRLYEDNVVICQYVNKCRVISIEKGAIYYYLLNRKESITNTFSKQAIKDYKWAMREMARQCISLFPDLKDETIDFYRTKIIGLWSGLVSHTSSTELLTSFFDTEKRYIILELYAIRLYIIKNLKGYMRISLKRKLQAISICFTPWLYVAYIKIRKVLK